MIKLRNGELAGVVIGLRALEGKELPIKAAYWVSKLIRKTMPDYQDYEKQRMALIQKHSQKDKEGRPVIVNNIYKMVDDEAFNKDFTELAGIDVELDGEQMAMSDFGNINVKPSELGLLMGTIIKDAETVEVTEKK